jgi:hypothetical protein
MIAQRLIEDARAAGLSMEVDGSDLIVEADRDPPADLLAELRQHKAEVIAFLRPPSRETADAAQDADDLDERAALIEYGAGVLRAWAEGYAALCAMPAPAGFSPERWQRIVVAAGKFLDRWAAKAIAYGWSDLDVFGCDAATPDRRFDCMGIALLDRWKVVDIDESGADLMTETAARLRYYRRPLPANTVRLWDLASAGQGRDAR